MIPSTLCLGSQLVSRDAEEAFKKTVQVDRLIDTLRDASPNKKDYEELAAMLMSTVDRLVHKTKEKIESATDVLKSILKHAVDDEVEITWPPRDPQALSRMKQASLSSLLTSAVIAGFALMFSYEVIHREQEGYLDEGFLSEVNAQLRQAKEDVDKPGLVAMLQKVLQFYASRVLSKRSYAKKGNEILKSEQLLESIISAPENEWNTLLINGLTIAKGEVTPEEFNSVIKKRIERVLIRTEGGSYQQRILTEYLKGIQSRTDEIVQALQGNTQ
ncbi:hypothetical protein KSS87_016025 [Heliosperma pusillum]|nr:hypothetical protein KSS87_016025 [Heliosperma pusillum]